MSQIATLILEAKTDGLRRAKGDLEQLRKSGAQTEQGVGQSMKGVGQSVDDISLGFKNAARAAGALAAAVGVGSALSKALQDARGFSRGLAEVSTLIEGTPQQMDELAKSSKDLASTFGTTAQSQVAAYYQAISAGVGGVKEATSVLEVANKFAVGGVTSVEVGVDTLTTAMNAYAASGLTAAEASDALFVGIKGGKTTADELGASLGRIVPIASAAGVEFDHVVAATAALTTQGLGTAEAVTGLRQVLSGIINPTTQAAKEAERLGIAFSADAMADQGLSAFLEEVIQKTGGSQESLAKLFGSVEALNAVLSFAGGGGEAFNKILDEMEVKAGATTAAYEKMADSADNKLTGATSQMNVALLEVGEIVLPMLVPVVQSVALAVTTLAQNMDTLGPVLAAVGVAFAALTAPVTLAAAGIATAATLIMSNWEAITGTFQNAKLTAHKAMLDFAMAVAGGIDTVVAAFTSFPGLIAQAFQNVVALISGLASEMVAALASMGAQVLKAAKEVGANIVAGIKAGIAQKWTDLKKYVSGLGTGMLDSMKSALRIQSPSREFMEIGAYTMEGLEVGIQDNSHLVTDAIGSVVNYMFDGFKDGLSGIVDIFKNTLQTMATTAAKNTIMLSLGVTGGVAGTAASAGGILGGGGGGGGILSGLLGGGGGIGGLLGIGGGGLAGLAGTGGIGGAIGGVASGLSGVLSGGGLASSFANLGGLVSGSVGGLGAIGAALPAIGAIGLGIAAVAKLFKKKKKTIDSGLILLVDEMDSIVKTFKRVKKSSIIGGSSKETFTKEAEEDVAKPVKDLISALQVSMGGLAEGIGVAFDDVMSQFSTEIKISTFKMEGTEAEEALAAGLTEMSDQMAAQILAVADGFDINKRFATTMAEVESFERVGMGEDATMEKVTKLVETQVDLLENYASSFARDGETATQTLERLSFSLQAVNPQIELITGQLYEISIAGADMASQLVDLFGGIDAMNAATGRYYDTFFSETEKLDLITRKTTDAMDALGLAMPQTRDQFRAMVESQDLMTASGREAYAALIGLSDAFAEILPAVANFSAAISEMVGTITTDIDAMISEATASQRASEQAATLWYRTARTLRDFIADLRGTAGALVSGQQAQAFNEARFQSLMASALAGDAQAATDITGAARALLDSTQLNAKTRVDQARAEARVLSDLGLLSGAADIEGARHDVIAGLHGEQIALLTTVKEYLTGGGALDPAQIDALNAQLGNLEAGIAAAEMINYAFLKDRLDVTVDLLATADLPADVRTLIANAQNGVSGTIDFVVRSDLGPDEKWLALTGASEHVKTIKYILDDAQWPDDVQSLALTTGGVYRQTIRYVAQNTMPADLTGLALADADTLLKSIRFTAQALPADVRRIVFNEIGPLQKRIDFMLGDQIPDHLQSLALDDADTFTRVISTVAGRVVPDQLQRLALSAPAVFSRTLNVLAGRLPGGRVRRLALDAATRFERVIHLRPGRRVSNVTARLALDSVGALNRTINLLAGSNVSPELRRIALAGNSELARVVNVALASGADQQAIRLALGNTGTYAVAVRAALTAPDDVRRIVFSDAGSYAAMVEAAFTQDMSADLRRVLLRQQGAYAVNVIGALGANMGAPMRRLLLEANTTAIRAVTVAMAFADSLSAADRELLLQRGTTALRTIMAAVNPAGITPQGVLYLDQLAAGDGQTRRGIRAGVDLRGLDPIRHAYFKELRAGNGDIDRIIRAGVDLRGLDPIRHAYFKELRAGNGDIDRILRGRVDLDNLSRAQVSMLEAVQGNSTGTLRLGGAFTFDPAGSFQQWFGTTTQAQIEMPMDRLRGALDSLADLMRREERAGALDSYASKLVGAGNGQFIATEDQIRHAAGIAGVDATGGIADVAARVSAFSGSDAISKLGVYNSGLRDLLVAQTQNPALQVNPSEYYKARPVVADRGLDAQAHWDEYGRAEMAANPNWFNPRMFDWASIGLNIPGFAAGGLHGGGLRIVGENGPELEATGPSRIYSAPQTKAMMGGDQREVVRAVRELKEEVSRLRDENRQLGIQVANNTKRTSDSLRKFDIDGLPPERV